MDFNWTLFFQFMIIGLASGSLIALIALGYTLVYGIIELINFAHGEVFMMGAFFASTVIVLTGVTGAFEAVDRDGVHAHPLGRQAMADAGALMDDDDAVLLEFLDVLGRLVAGRLDDLHAAVDDHLHQARIVWRGH